MKTEDILNLDLRKEENKEIIQKVLKLIKPLSRFSGEIPFEGIEKAIVIMSKKYKMRIRDITPDVWSNENNTIWRAVIINEENLKTMGVIYGISLYELFAKTAILMYAEVRKGIQTRE